VITSTGKDSKWNLRRARNPREALAHDRQRVFGGKNQHGAGAPDGELPQTGRAGSDAHGDIQGEKAFAALGLAAEDADGLIGPEPFD
jgi:hypothetical protein